MAPTGIFVCAQLNCSVTCSSAAAAQRVAQPLPVAQSVLGVDFGTKWTGLAHGAGKSCEALEVGTACLQPLHKHAYCVYVPEYFVCLRKPQ